MEPHPYPRFFFASVAVLLALASACAASGQVLNIEKSRRQVAFDKDTLLARYSVQGRVSRQGIRLFSFGNALNTAYLRQGYRIILIGEQNYLQRWDDDDQSQLTNDGYLHLRCTYFRTRKFGVETFVQGQYDIARSLEHRFLLGQGVRLALAHSKKATVHLGVGAMYEDEHWVRVDEDEDIDENVRNRFLKSTNYLSMHASVSESFDFNFACYYMARYEDFFSPRVSGDANFNFKIKGRFSFLLKANWWYEAQTPIEVDNVNYRLDSGLSFSL